MVYSPLHPISHVKGEKLTQVAALFKRTSPKAATIIGFIFLCLASAFGIYLGFYFNLKWLYIAPTAIMAVVALVFCWQYVQDRKLGKD
jgi:4-hydroxybenzoate polyprenyltransferase